MTAICRNKASVPSHPFEMLMPPPGASMRVSAAVALTDGVSPLMNAAADLTMGISTASFSAHVHRKTLHNPCSNAKTNRNYRAF